MDRIRKKIEDLLGKYDKAVEEAIWTQIQALIITRGKFNVEDWVLEQTHPVVENENDTPPFASFKLAGSVRLVPKPKTPRKIEDSILRGAMIHHYKMESLPGYVDIEIKGHQDVDMVLNGPLRFNFELTMRTTDPRLNTVIEESLSY